MAVFHAFWLLYTSWFNSKQRQIYPLMMIRRFQWFIKFFGTNLAKVTLLVILTIFYTGNVYVGLKRCQTELLANILFLLHLLYIYNMNCNLFSVMKIWKKKLNLSLPMYLFFTTLKTSFILISVKGLARVFLHRVEKCIKHCT